MNEAAQKPLSILIVDDNRDLADSLGTLLEIWGHEVRITYDGLSGYQAAYDRAPDCLIADIQMPGLTGYELARRVRDEPKLRRTQLVALSAFSDAKHVARAEMSGFDFQLVKSHDNSRLAEILSMVEQIKKIAEQTQELARRNVDLAGQTQELAKQNVELAGETKQLLKEVKEDIREVKEDIKEVKKQVKEIKGSES
ncbi:response regulator [Fimbriiglobus ruber]|uniref:Chemotaxis protein methyltransferase CheR n=1 Tax=Fimbriiglobus ruber TaxID=1908690 RepID=A0A225E2V2_9BACT|nr:response regulator [Fimbriiglobus ruber]OWK44406.1 Chemotaxis protein methyltransferase CheR [Fimbriiglobus ruber]